MELQFDKVFGLSKEVEELPPEKLVEEKNERFFSGTVKYREEKTDYITSFMNEKKIIIGRLFLDKSKHIKYIEIFKNKKLDILGISENITFLHEYLEDKKDHYNPDKFIGFRYYESIKKEKKESYVCGNYFTLVRKNYSKYFILEKDNSINDMNGDKFYDENINCYQIMKKIIFEKCKNKTIGDIGDIFPEVIGYCFALVNSFNIGNMIILEPLIANLNNKFCLEESVKNENFKKDVIYIEPFIYDRHISTIIFTFKDARYNILLDMSHHHFKNQYSLFSFLPKALRNANNLVYPKKGIQECSSCFIWFIGIIECLLKNKKYSNFSNIYQDLANNNLEFYIEIINLLSKEIEGRDDLINVIKKEEKVFKIKEIDFDRYPFFDSDKYYEIHKDVVFSKFLDIEGLIELKYFISPLHKEIFYQSQSYLERIYGFKNLLLLNLKFYEILKKNEDMKKDINSIFTALKTIDNQINNFLKNYDNAFYRFNMSFYILYFKSVLDQIAKPYPFEADRIEEIRNFNYRDFISTTTKDFNNFKENTIKEVTIFSLETIVQELNSTNELCLNLMNK